MTDLAFPLMHMEDGSQYQLPKELVQALHLIYSMSPHDYLRARVYLAPAGILGTAQKLCQNPILSSLFEEVVLKHYWMYHAQTAGMNIGTKMSNVPVPEKKQ